MKKEFISGDCVISSDNFVVKCSKCGKDAKIILVDNGACGDPECCGDYKQWTEFHCEYCKIIESTEAM